MTTSREPTVDERSIVHIGLFDHFSVTVCGVAVPDSAWSRRSAAALLKLLALAPGRRLHREQAIDALWPGTQVDVGAARLHKAAHYARRALALPRALVLAHETVTLLPDAEVVVDVLDFCARAEEALRGGSEGEVRTALGRSDVELLPEDRYAPWSDAIRTRVSGLRDQLLARLATASPNVAAVDASAGPGRGGQPRLVGRRAAADVLRDRIVHSEQGDGGTLIVSGPAGVGRSALLQAAARLAARRGWWVGCATASSLESPWPYATALEAIGALGSCEMPGELRSGSSTDTGNLRTIIGGGRLDDAEETRALLFPVVEELLLARARTRPVLLVVDDLDEADLASVRLLHYLARRATGRRMLLIVSHRSPAGGGSRQLRDSLLSRDLARVLTLTPLSPAATGRLVTERFPNLGADTIADVVAASGGLPLAATQLGRFLSGDQLAVPWPRLPDSVLRCLRLATGLEESFEIARVAARAGISTAAARRHLAAAEAALILEPTDVGHRFRHPLLRAVLATAPASDVAAGHSERLSASTVRRTTGRPICRGRHPSSMARRPTGARTAASHTHTLRGVAV